MSDDVGVDETVSDGVPVEKVRVTLRIDKPLWDYMGTTTANVSGMMNALLWDALDEKIPENGPETEAPQMRKRVLRLQREAVRKEIAELERHQNSVETALEAIEDRDREAWHQRMDRTLKAHLHPQWARQELVEMSDPKPENETENEE